MTKAAYRRLMGGLVGGLVGLVFTLTLGLVRVLALPDLPLFIPPLGLVGDVAVGIGAGIILGLISCWTESSAWGPIFAAIAGSIAFLVVGFVSGQTPVFMVPTSLVTTVFLMFPFGAMMLPITILIRVAVNQWTDYRKYSMFQPRRWLLTVILLAVAFGVGNIFRFNSDAKIMLPRMQTLVQSGLQAPNTDALPAPLRGPEITNFIGKATSNYQLEWTNQNLTIYQIPRPLMSEADMAVVIAHFDNGWNLVCLYPNAQLDPRCKGFDTLPISQGPYNLIPVGEGN